MQATAEDAVFRYYLPLARSLADAAAVGGTVGGADLADLDQAAELGLAQAVLGWRGRSARGFERFARGMIMSRLRRARPDAAERADGPPASEQ